MNLIPNKVGTTPGYWCSWGLQNYLAAAVAKSNSFGFTGHSYIGEMLTEYNIDKHINKTDFL